LDLSTKDTTPDLLPGWLACVPIGKFVKATLRNSMFLKVAFTNLGPGPAHPGHAHPGALST